MNAPLTGTSCSVDSLDVAELVCVSFCCGCNGVVLPVGSGDACEWWTSVDGKCQWMVAVPVHKQQKNEQAQTSHIHFMAKRNALSSATMASHKLLEHN